MKREKTSLEQKVAEVFGPETLYATEMWSRGETSGTLRYLGVFFHRKTGKSFLFLEGEDGIVSVADGEYQNMIKLGQAFHAFARLDHVDLYAGEHGMGALDEERDIDNEF